ncbi:MAG TPA: 4-hydroxy-tetrahydrodipicolinate reductase [Verrucomicrobiae bacterium]|nr:4-hydroxy-tetrahydrodipicolinate reductase [Verrucomicrobiae bacterium]
MTKIIITGAKGRMGQALSACAERMPEVEVAAKIDLGDDLQAAITKTDVVIDFSFHTATVPIAELCARSKKALVIGTTGHSIAEESAIRKLQSSIPIVWASNYSTGVNALFWLTRKAAEILGAGFDVEVVEMHHNLKKDAPSGTATTLAQILAEVRQKQLGEAIQQKHGRQGIVGERGAAEIGVHSLRGGDVVGDHTVILAGLGERLELTHKASSRQTFASGALRAAQWVVRQPPGLYDMQHVLGLK